MRCCKTCTHLAVSLTINGQRRVLKDQAYRCTVEVPKRDLPDCMTKFPGFRDDPIRMFMTGDMGTTCPFWAPLNPT